MRNKGRSRDTQRVPIRFSGRRIVLTLSLAVAAGGLYYSSTFVLGSERYLRQLLIFLTAVFVILAVVSLCRLFTKEIRRELYRRAGTAILGISTRWHALTRRIREKLGISNAVRIKGIDERDIIFRPEDAMSRRKRRRLASLKYSDMEDNRARIRFIWAKYVLRQIKKDNPPMLCETPLEIKARLDDANESDTRVLFDIYTLARYAGENAVITDDEVLRQYRFVAGKGKL